jgi:hypothetical protein
VINQPVINLRSPLGINRPVINQRSPLVINRPVINLRSPLGIKLPVMSLGSQQETNQHSRWMINHRKATAQTRLSLVPINPHSLRMTSPPVINQQKETNRRFPIRQQP